MIRIGLLFLLLGSGMAAWAQVPADTTLHATDLKPDTVVLTSGDTAVAKVDSLTLAMDSLAKRYDPRKALLYAAVLPGSGQIYNKKYWKLPLVYGGLGLLVNAVSFYQGQYLTSKRELFYTINHHTTRSPLGFEQTQLRSIVDQTRRQRDFFMVLTGLVYILQMVDAHVDAHLKEFEFNPKLQVRIEPRMGYDVLTGRSTGVALIMRF